MTNKGRFASWRKYLRTALPAVLAAAVIFPIAASGAGAMGTAFTYRGQLSQGGTPYAGVCDFQFGLWDDASTGAQIGATVSALNTAVTNGVFEASLDFGAGSFSGQARWLETAVRCPAGSGGYTTLSPRQALSPMPYALWAGGVDAVNVNSLGAGAGLTYSGGQFSISNGAISNVMLANSSLTISAGSGLTGGGSVSLGGSTSLGIGTGAVSNSMLANNSVTVTAGSGLTGGGSASLGGSTSLSVASAYKLPQGCGAGEVPVSDGAGGWTCGANATPSGLVAYFAMTTCPTGWTEVTSARGRVIMALPASGTLSGTVGTALTNVQTRTLTLAASNLPSFTSIFPQQTLTTSTNGAHSHTFTTYGNTGDGSGVGGRPTTNGVDGTGSVSTAGAHNHTVTIPQTDVTFTGTDVPADVTMPYIQLLACQKN